MQAISGLAEYLLPSEDGFPSAELEECQASRPSKRHTQSKGPSITYRLGDWLCWLKLSVVDLTSCHFITASPRITLYRPDKIDFYFVPQIRRFLQSHVFKITFYALGHTNSERQVVT